MSLLAFLVFGLATWRMSSLLAREAGPWDVFLKIRELSGIVHDENKEVVMIPERFFAQMISCVWCNSIYIATFWTSFLFVAICLSFIWKPLLFLPVIPAFPFALSALAILVDSRVFHD